MPSIAGDCNASLPVPTCGFCMPLVHLVSLALHALAPSFDHVCQPEEVLWEAFCMREPVPLRGCPIIVQLQASQCLCSHHQHHNGVSACPWCIAWPATCKRFLHTSS